MIRTPKLRRFLAALAVPTLMLALVACGSDPEESAEPGESTPLSTGAGETEPKESEEPETDEPAEAAAGGEVSNEEFLAAMQTAIDKATTAKMSMRLDTGGGALQADGEADYTTNPVTMAMTMTIPGMGQGPIEMRLVDGVMYMNMGQLTQGKFVKFDLNDPASLPPGMDSLSDQLNPLASFRDFTEALKSATYEGTDDVDGEQLEHYAVVVDTSKIEALAEMPAQAQLPKELTYDLWFDGEGLMRQLRLVMDMAGTPFTTDVRLFDWGTPVEVVAPPPGEIAQAPVAPPA